MRACACDTASRLCGRTVFCCPAFSLFPPLASTCSSPARAALFAGFTATMGESDFSGPFIVGFGLRPSRRGPCKTPQGQSRDIPVPDQEASAHARVYDDAEPTMSRDRDMGRIAFCRTESIGAPKLVFAAQWLAYAIPCQRFASPL